MEKNNDCKIFLLLLECFGFHEKINEENNIKNKNNNSDSKNSKNSKNDIESIISENNNNIKLIENKNIINKFILKYFLKNNKIFPSQSSEEIVLK